MRTDPANPADWFLLARDRLEKSDALFLRFGPSWPGVELLQETSEIRVCGVISKAVAAGKS